jgi:hypothetical protein
MEIVVTSSFPIYLPIKKNILKLLFLIVANSKNIILLRVNLD